MNNEMNQKIISLLSETEYVTSGKLGSLIGKSDKTTRNLLKDADACLRMNGAAIVTKHSMGYIIEVTDRDKYEAFQTGKSDKSDNRSARLIDNSESRVEYIVELLISEIDYIKLDDLEDVLYVSRNTLSLDMKKVETLLNRYGITLIRKPNYGIKIESNELNIRCILSDLMLNDDYLYIFEEQDVKHNGYKDIFADCIRYVSSKFTYRFSEIAYQRLMINLSIILNRTQKGFYVEDEELTEEDSIKKEAKIAGEIIKYLGKKLKIKFPQSEITHLTILIAGGKVGGHYRTVNSNVVISAEISELAMEMLKEIKSAFNIAFTDNIQLQVSLAAHLVRLVIRVKYGISIKNPLLDEIKEHYSLAYAMAVQACTVINEKYQTKISDAEIAYVAFFFALYIENEHINAKKTILLVCSTGKLSAKLLAQQYERAFANNIKKIKTADALELHDFDFTGIDYIFTTVPINAEIPKEIPILQIKYFLDTDTKGMVSKALTKMMTSNMRKYYSKEMFISSLNLNTKYEVLKYMCEYANKKKNLPKKFYESVLKRESLARTEFGNHVAMPHPYEILSKETFVLVAILKEPILWDERMVKVVFLVAVDDSSQSELENFYKVTSKFLLNSYFINELMRQRDYESMIEMMSKIEEEL